MKATIEICVEGARSALAAAEGGADRIELCENLAVGGVTPSTWTMAMICQLDLPVQVLIRPRGGDFCYDDREREVMALGVQAAPAFGASGVVLGVLDRQGRVDRPAMAELITAAWPTRVTFHKAFDEARDPFEALDDLIELGVERVLTSGQAPTAREGLRLLADLTRYGAGRISVMAGGSIRLADIRPLLDAGLREIHLGSAACRDGATDPQLVREIVAAAATSAIFHITTLDAWERARAAGWYRAESLASEGFIHGSTAGQVTGSANRFFRGRSGLVVLRVDLDRLLSPVTWVESPDSDLPFPHILGPINLDAVTEVVPLAPDDRGQFRWPVQAGGSRGTS